MSGQWHPDAEAIASFRAGLTGGFRGRRLAAHIAGCSRCAAVGDQLDTVTTVLASVSAPALPDAFERQISAAIAAEAAARGGVSRAADGGLAERAPADRRPRRALSRHRQRGLRFRPAMALVPVLACLLAGFGYLLSSQGPSSLPAEGPDNAAGPVPTAYPSASASAPASAAAGSSGLGFNGNLNGPVVGASGRLPRLAQTVPFLVISSGTKYRESTLRAQVLNEMKSLTYRAAGHPGIAPTAISSTTGAAGPFAGFIPSKFLAGCVQHLTRGITPSLVDRALYQGKPAYVIAVPKEVWVVGLGCTASDPELIASTSLTAAP